MYHHNLKKLYTERNESQINKELAAFCIPRALSSRNEVWIPLAKQLEISLELYEIEDLYKNGTLYFQEKSIKLLVLPVNIQIHEKNFSDLDNIESFASVSTGMDHVDLVFLEKKKIPFFNAPGFNKVAVVEYVLCALNHLYEYKKLPNIKVGIIGLGRIGSCLARHLRILGIPYLAYDPAYPKESVELEEVLAKSDVITFHVPLSNHGTNYDTREMVDTNYISKFNKNACIINTSRGKIFTPQSYELCCKSHRNVMDVFPEENRPVLSKYVKQAYLSTPHIAGYEQEARMYGSLSIAKQFVDFFGLNVEANFWETCKKNIEKTIQEESSLDFSILNSIEEDQKFLHHYSNNLSKNFIVRRSNYPPRLNLRRVKEMANTNYIKGFNPYLQSLIELAEIKP